LCLWGGRLSSYFWRFFIFEGVGFRTVYLEVMRVWGEVRGGAWCEVRVAVRLLVAL
jgi:hypothetical protein